MEKYFSHLFKRCFLSLDLKLQVSSKVVTSETETGWCCGLIRHRAPGRWKMRVFALSKSHCALTQCHTNQTHPALPTTTSIYRPIHRESLLRHCPGRETTVLRDGLCTCKAKGKPGTNAYFRTDCIFFYYFNVNFFRAAPVAWKFLG